MQANKEKESFVTIWTLKLFPILAVLFGILQLIWALSAYKLGHFPYWESISSQPYLLNDRLLKNVVGLSCVSVFQIGVGAWCWPLTKL